MVEKENQSEELEEVSFPLNKKLLEEANKIKKERAVIRGRLDKIKESKTSVSDTVFDKVKNDYIRRLEETTDALLQKKNDIDRELATLYETRTKVAENVEVHKEKLEEIHFRHELGEYDDATFNRVATEENNKLSKFEKILAAVNSNIKRYESIFEGEGDLGASAYSAKEAPFSVSDSEEASDKGHEEPGTDAEVVAEEGGDYMVSGSEAGYFEGTDEVALPQDTEITGHTPAVTSKGGNVGLARLTIIEGEGKMTSYDVRKEATIGRASSNMIVLKEAKVSRQHATVTKKGEEYLVEDLNSSNGVFVNNERIKEYALSDGDEIRIGDFLMKFTIS